MASLCTRYKVNKSRIDGISLSYQPCGIYISHFSHLYTYTYHLHIHLSLTLTPLTYIYTSHLHLSLTSTPLTYTSLYYIYIYRTLYLRLHDMRLTNVSWTTNMRIDNTSSPHVQHLTIIADIKNVPMLFICHTINNTLI